MSRRAYGVADIRRTIRSRRAELVGYANVIRVCVGQKAGARGQPPRLAIRFIVKRKVARSRLPRDQVIPSRLRGVAQGGKLADFFIPTDVEKGPERFSLLAIEGGAGIRGTRRGRAALAYGTKRNVAGLLTTAHVVSRVGTRGVGGSVHAEGQEIGYVGRATLITANRTNRMDAAFVRLYDDVRAHWNGLRGQSAPVVRCGAIPVGSPHEFFYIGRRNRLKRCLRPDRPETGPIYIAVGGYEVPFDDFAVLTLRDGAVTEHGDSGALLVRRGRDGLVASGLVFAGRGTSVAVFPIRRVFSALEARGASDTGSREDVSFGFC